MVEKNYRAVIRFMGLVCYGSTEEHAEERMATMLQFLLETYHKKDPSGKAVLSYFKRANLLTITAIK